MTVLTYKAEESVLFAFADDFIPRWPTNFVMLDPDTLAGADMFENFFVLRLPAGSEENAEDDPTATRFRWENGTNNSAKYKMDHLCNFHVGEVITQMQKCTPVLLGPECILYVTSVGGIGAMVPFEMRDDLDFFVHLEMFLRIEALPLCG